MFQPSAYSYGEAPATPVDPSTLAPSGAAAWAPIIQSGVDLTSQIIAASQKSHPHKAPHRAVKRPPVQYPVPASPFLPAVPAQPVKSNWKSYALYGGIAIGVIALAYWAFKPRVVVQRNPFANLASLLRKNPDTSAETTKAPDPVKTISEAPKKEADPFGPTLQWDEGEELFPEYEE